MFDVGFTELLLLAIIGLLVLGPERLPRVARTLGGLTRKARSSWLNLKRSIDAEIHAEEMKKPLKKMQDDVRSAVDGVDKQLKEVSGRASSSMAATAAAIKSSGQPAEKTSDQHSSGPAEVKSTDNDSS